MIAPIQGAIIASQHPPRTRREARLAQVMPEFDEVEPPFVRAAPRHAEATSRRGGGGPKGGAPKQRKRRRWPWIVFPILVLLLIVASIGAVFVLQALSVRDNLQEAKGRITQVVPMIKAGDTEGVKALAAEVLDLTTESNEIVSNPLWQFAGGVPLVGANVEAVGETTKATHVLVRDAMPIALDLLAKVDVKNLTVAGGGINLQPFRDMQPLLPALREAFDGAKKHVDEIDRDAILPFVDENIGQLVDIVDQAVPALGMAEKYLPNALSILADGGERTYAILFQNNAESRSTGGNPGAAAILTISNGAVEMRTDRDVARFLLGGRSGDYPQKIEPKDKSQLFEKDTWGHSQNFTRLPDFADVASLVRGLWEDTTDEQLDGVFAIDPVMLSYMLSVAGPVSLEGEKEPITAENAVSLLLFDTYERFGTDAAGSDAYFAKATAGIFSKVMGGGWDPLGMIEQVKKGMDEQRLYMWFANENEEAMAVELGLDGAVEATNEKETQLGVYLNNASYSKLEYFLKTSVTVTCSAADRTVTTSVTMNNEVPRSNLNGWTLAWRNESLGYPRTTMLFDVISFALPGGAFAGTDPAEGDRDGWDRKGVYNGREAKSIFVEIPMGESRTVSFTSTVPEDAKAPLAVRYTPTVTQTPVTIDQSCADMFPAAK